MSQNESANLGSGLRGVTAAVTKSELIEKISESLKLPAGKAEAIVNCVFDSMVKALERGEGIEIRGLGSFTVREYKAYEGRNPRTGETVHVAPKRLPFFKVGKDLRERVNAGAGTPMPADTSGPDDDLADDPELDQDGDED
jgi:integration host factor subunit beta